MRHGSPPLAVGAYTVADAVRGAEEAGVREAAGRAARRWPVVEGSHRGALHDPSDGVVAVGLPARTRAGKDPAALA